MDMEITRKKKLSFAALDQRLRDVPEGPSSSLDTPSWLKKVNTFAAIAALVAVLPYVLTRWMPQAAWMVVMAKAGFILFITASLPGLIRSYGVLGVNLWRWRSEQVRQLDHDLPYFQSITDWLAGHAESDLLEHHRVIRLTQGQLTLKLGLLAGGLDRLGMLPVLVSMFLFLRQWEDLLSMPLWQVSIGFGLILLYFIVMVANLMRIRLQLYESLLSEAISTSTRA